MTDLAVSSNGSVVEPKRVAPGKRLRFEVFKRDLFTCRYCGAQPPEIVLVIDHMVPVREGGPTTLDNLITACKPCNDGKAGVPLGKVQPRLDADLLYLSVQQEIAELHQYQVAIAEREGAISDLVDTFQDRWQTSTGLDWAPAERLIRNLLARYDYEIVGRALEDVAAKLGGGYQLRHWDRYLWTVAKTLAGERD